MLICRLGFESGWKSLDAVVKFFDVEYEELLAPILVDAILKASCG